MTKISNKLKVRYRLMRTKLQIKGNTLGGYKAWLLIALEI